MGGNGSGGARVGTGSKAKSASLLRLHSGRDRGKLRADQVGPAVEPPKPEGLSDEAGRVWLELAPHATAAGTLVPGTVPAFVRLCQAIVQHAAMQAQVDRDGLTYLKVTIDGAGQEHTEVKAHPLIGKAQTLDNQIRSWMKDFAINPFGKPLAVAEEPVDPFAQFDQAG